MINFTVPSVTQGLHKGLEHLKHHGKLSSSRNGLVLVSPWPVMTTYTDPTNRVLTSPLRDANPFFHVMEALWMLAGRNDLAWPKLFNQRFKEYSDDDTAIHGAYGHRWRRHFGFDQLEVCAASLRQNMADRRVVLAMWDPICDLGHDGVDFPCNTHAYFDARDGRLNLTVCCRSNDIWWGCYGANAVHFSFLLEYMAGSSGLEVGVYRQLSSNFHLYPEIVNMSRYEELWVETREVDLYTKASGVYHRVPDREPHKVPLMGLPMNGADVRQQTFDEEVNLFLDNPLATYATNHDFFPLVARPMYLAWQAWKAKDWGEAFDQAHFIGAQDWRVACVEWLERRRAKTLEQ